MAAVAEIPQLIDGGDQVGAQGVQVDITHQFKPIEIILADDRFEPVLEKMAMAFVPQIERDGIPGKQALHHSADRSGAGPQQQVKVIGDEHPRVTGGGGLGENRPEPRDEIVTVPIVGEYLSSLDTAADDVVQSAGCVYAGLSGHGEEGREKWRQMQLILL